MGGARSSRGFNASDIFGRAANRAARGQDSEVRVTLSLADVLAAPLKRQMTMNGPSGARTIDVNLPRGIREGSRLKLRGQGGAGRNGGENGDLYVVVHIEPDARFEIDGYDLTTTARVAPQDAVLGGTAEVSTPEGTVKVKVPAGAQNGMKLRLHGRGLPMRGGASLRGDLYARIEIVIPKDLSARERELWQKIKDLHAE